MRQKNDKGLSRKNLIKVSFLDDEKDYHQGEGNEKWLFLIFGYGCKSVQL